MTLGPDKFLDKLQIHLLQEGLQNHSQKNNQQFNFYFNLLLIEKNKHK